MTELAMGLLAEIVETPGLEWAVICDMFSREHEDLLAAADELLKAECVEWRLDYQGIYYYPLRNGIKVIDDRRIQDTDDDIPF